MANMSEASASREATHVVAYGDATITFGLVCCCVLIVAGVVGNLLTVIALLRNQKLRSASTTIFICSLCVTDLIFCSVNLPMTAHRYAHHEWTLGRVLCRIFPMVFYGNVCASLFNMMMITINRYVLIAHYHRFDRVYNRVNCALMIAFCWLVPAALLALVCISYNHSYIYAFNLSTIMLASRMNRTSGLKYNFSVASYSITVVNLFSLTAIIGREGGCSEFPFYVAIGTQIVLTTVSVAFLYILNINTVKLESRKPMGPNHDSDPDPPTYERACVMVATDRTFV